MTGICHLGNIKLYLGTYSEVSLVWSILQPSKNSYHVYLYIQIENKKRQLTTLFTAYIVVRFLNLQHKIQITDNSGIGFKTNNPLKTIGKLIFFSDRNSQE